MPPNFRKVSVLFSCIYLFHRQFSILIYKMNCHGNCMCVNNYYSLLFVSRTFDQDFYGVRYGFLFYERCRPELISYNTNIANLAIKSGSDHKSDPATLTAAMPTIITTPTTIPVRCTIKMSVNRTIVTWFEYVQNYYRPVGRLTLYKYSCNSAKCKLINGFIVCMKFIQ